MRLDRVATEAKWSAPLARQVPAVGLVAWGVLLVVSGVGFIFVRTDNGPTRSEAKGHPTATRSPIQGRSVIMTQRAWPLCGEWR
jgi:hypothetical protein